MTERRIPRKPSPRAIRGAMAAFAPPPAEPDPYALHPESGFPIDLHAMLKASLRKHWAAGLRDAALVGTVIEECWPATIHDYRRAAAEVEAETGDRT